MAYERNCELKPGIQFPAAMKRVALEVEYAGSGFNGFQRQASTSNTVQEKLESALSWVADEVVSIVCAGRTDAGVHATGQVIHMDTLATRPEKAWVQGVNTRLPDEIRIRWAKEVVPEFHARFGATYRAYRYIFHTDKIRSATLGKQVTHCAQALDFEAMSDAARHLIGEHDFSAFRSSQCQANNPVRMIESIDWCRQGSLVAMQIKANAFLHHMVRNIVGSLIEVGCGKKPAEWIAQVLKSKNRCAAGATAAPWGLYLVDVGYPEKFCLPTSPQGPAFFCWNNHSSL